MKKREIFLILSAILSLFGTTPSAGKPPISDSIPAHAPYLKKAGNVFQLMVNQKPYLILGGELRNSAASSIDYLRPIWPILKSKKLNTLLLPVSWEIIEPVEGSFDFQLLDSIISTARQYDLHLVLLWFGAYKNGASSYVPSWVKRDQQRFPLAKIKTGRSINTVSPFGENLLLADGKAFSSLMRHLKEFDRRHTVLMVQVENEVGILGDSRDRSPLAEEAFAQQVPAALMKYLEKNKGHLRPLVSQAWKKKGFKNKGSWVEVFGQNAVTDELFMAWRYATYISAVASLGKKEYALPMFVNAWIVQPSDRGPGDFPSGGPVADVLDIWAAGASNVDFFAPDIYLSDFKGIVKQYVTGHAPFFIPESVGGPLGAANAFYAIGACGSIGYSPYGIEDPIGHEVSPLGQAYDILSQLAPLLLSAQKNGAVRAVLLNNKESEDILLGGYVFHLSQLNRWTKEPSYAVVINTADEEYFIAGSNVLITFPPSGGYHAGIDYAREGAFADDQWVPGRLLNGGDTESGSQIFLPPTPGIRKIKLYHYR